jgi:hypothetical protein
MDLRIAGHAGPFSTIRLPTWNAWLVGTKASLERKRKAQHCRLHAQPSQLPS